MCSFKTQNEKKNRSTGLLNPNVDILTIKSICDSENEAVKNELLHKEK